MASINKHPARFELTAVYRHPQAKADIVLVHGLNGAPEKTWKAPNGVYWPTDLLPASLKEQHANVLVYGYNADVYGGFWERPVKNPSDNFIHHHAQTLVTTLTLYRKSEGTERNPIIWVAHSLGGILTKRALLYSNDLRDPHQEDLRSIFVSTYGIIFLGTPHNGSNAAAWGGVVQRFADAFFPKKLFDTESVLLKSLKRDSETLLQISNQFLEIYQNFKIHMAHENQKTDVKGSKMLVVDASSASPQLVGVTYYGIEATHSGMCKFASETAPGYRTVSTAIRAWIADAPNVIPIRWEVEEENRRVRANLENFERTRRYQESALVSATRPQAIGQDTSQVGSPELPLPAIEPSRAISAPLLTNTPHPDSPHSPKLLPALPEPRDEHEPLFIHPETFRPNSYFIGREDELRGLHEMLMDRKRRSEGTSAVLIQCLPGGGKTHLARQYVFQHRDDYPGGVYWVRAKSRHELEYWFWRIARNEALRGLVDRRDVEELRDPRKIVQIVRRWLSAQADWLVVFDGVQFDTDGLHEFIPDARNTSLIYTSTERAVAGDPRFDNPQVLELGLLTAQQAQDLLLLEMDRKRPWSPEDQGMALELVQLMGRLPLMIHVAAQHLKATREPLARYLKSYRSRPKAGDLPAYKAVREQLENRGENAALNLMSLLVFFDQHIPVEMLTLGLSALDKVTPVKTCDATHRKANLNNTLKVLIAFALVERSESDDISPTSSRSSKRSFDRHVDYLDLLRIHSVVQAFFIDSLHEQHQIPFWLERAIAVWYRSYDEADRRIQEDPRIGLPDDYRRFCIHGQKLLQHLHKFERRYPNLAKARPQLEQRLEKIQGQIDDLSHAIQTNIIDGSAEEHPASVFDRVSTSSQSDAATMQSHSSQASGIGSLGDGDSELVQSPVVELLEQDIPYPNSPVMPTVPEIFEDDDQETVILSVAGTQVHVGATEVVEIVSLPPDPHDNYQEGTAYDGWQDAIPNHRVIKRQEIKRYHDRAGAWRDKMISDPRVGLTWEVAVGSISSKREASRSPLGARLTAQSEAEMELNKIKRAAPPSPKSREGFGSQTFTRPKTLLGRTSWALPQAVKTPDAEVAEIPPEEFSSGFAQILSSPRTWTEATLKMLRKTVMPSDKPADTIPEPTPPLEAELIVPPAPIFRGSRSANSSPGSNASPFPPPSFSGIPTEDLLAKPGTPLVVRRWDTAVYHPDGTPLSSSGVEWSSTPDLLSLSYPTISTSRTQHHGNIHPSQLALHGGPAAGYSSQPMSRDGSHQSNPSISINSPFVAQSPTSRSSSPSRPDPAHRHSLSLPGAPATLPIPTPPSSSSRLSPFTRARPPSYTETEPSPRLDTPFPDVDTSYHRWEQHHGLAPIPPTAAEGADMGASFPPAVPGGNKSSLTRWRPGRGTRIRGLGRNGGGNSGSRGRRAHSLSPSSSPPAAGPGEGSGPSPVPWPSPPPPPSSSLSSGRAGTQAQAQAQAQTQTVSPTGAGMGVAAGYNNLHPPSHPNHQHHHHLHRPIHINPLHHTHHQNNHPHHHHPLAEWSTPETDGPPPPTTTTAAPAAAEGGEPMSQSASGASGNNGGVAAWAAAAAGIRVGDGTVVEFGSPGLGSGTGFASGSGIGTGVNGRGGDGGSGGGTRLRSGSFPGMGRYGLGILE